MSAMPAPPKGMVWELRLNPLHDNATLWLYRRSRLTGRSNGWSVTCAGLRAPDWPMRAHLSIQKATIEEIVEAIVEAAGKLVAEVAGEPGRRAKQDAQAAELSKRLGIKVVVER